MGLKWEEVYAFEHTPHPIEYQMYYSADRSVSETARAVPGAALCILPQCHGFAAFPPHPCIFATAGMPVVDSQVPRMTRRKSS